MKISRASCVVALSFLKTVLLVSLSATAAAEDATPPKSSDTARKPNILYIMSDDHRSTGVGCYGSRLAYLNPTPNIDRIAKEGVRLANYFCTNSICTPSRATIMSGQVTAWAPRASNGGMQWVIVEFPQAVDVSKIEIVETYNPGAIVRVSSVSTPGDATEIWSGTDPIVPVAGMGTAVIKPKVATHTRRIKIELDTSKVPGWNEIDAVSIIDEKGNIQWASRAWASSSFGKNRKAPSWFWP